MKMRKMISVFADVFFIFLFVYLLIFPQYASIPTRNALMFCARTLVPSLFIYMVLSKIIISLPITDILIKRVGIAPIMLAIGSLCGCPIGAKNAVSLFESKKISKRFAEYLCSFTNNASISFVIGYVGGELFGNTAVGLKLFLFQIIASILTAVIMKKLLFGKEKLPTVIPSKAQKVGLREAVSDSAITMINLCACAVFFIVCGDAVSGIFNINGIGIAVLKSVLEFSSGCASALSCGIYALPITAFSIGFCGLSVALQVRSVTAGRLSIRPFIYGKVISASVMTALTVIFG